MLSPIEFGAPEKFQEWRTEQTDAILRLSDTDKRFLCLNKPTGAGKALTAVMAGKVLGLRTLVLTGTRTLQNVYRDEEMTGKDVRGQQNYYCKAVEPYGPLSHFADRRGPLRVDQAPCHVGVECRLKFNGCTYFDAVNAAREEDSVSTNYDYHLAIGKSILTNDGEETLGKFDLLVLDEAHAAVDKTCGALRTELLDAELTELLGISPLPGTASLDRWRSWADVVLVAWESEMERMTTALSKYYIDLATVEEYKKMKRLGNSLTQVSMLEDDWVVGRTKRGDRTTFDPVWPAAYTEALLFRNIPKVLLLSATITPKTLEVLGIPKEQSDYHEYPSTFPVRRRPVYALSTGPYMKFDMTPEDEQYLIDLLDLFLRSRFADNRKGIIHCVSYKRMMRIQELSEFGSRFIIHDDGRDKESAITRFRKSKVACALLSPSVTTGEDFPDDDCRFIIIPKLPFVDTRDPIVARRELADPGYSGYQMINTLVQSTGRGMRHPKDWCESIILDGNFTWAWDRYKQHAPKWWRDSIVWVSSIPKKLEIL